jgi:hypothetical protein
MKHPVPPIALVLLTTAFSGLAAPPDGGDKAALEDVCLLNNAGVETDGPGLVAFFRKQALTDEKRRAIREAIGQLGDDSFEVRENATRKLIALEEAAEPALRRVLAHRDLEIRRRAKRCLDALNDISPTVLRAAAARVLVARKPPGAVEVLLAFLPDSADAAEEERLVAALAVLAVRDGKVDRALAAALTDRAPLRRAIAGEVLAGDARHRAVVRKLLTDPHPAVRLHVAVALASVREKDAVPVLIDATAELPVERTREAQDLLRLLAGAKAPRATPGASAAERKRYRDEWSAWWKEQAAAVDLAAVAAGPPKKAKVAAARASAIWTRDATPDMAFDEKSPNGWSSGNYAPQWIEADLGAAARLATLRLMPSQLPNVCDTTHEMWVSDVPIGDDRGKAKLVHTFKGRTENGRPIAFEFPKGVSARYVQVRTTASESWVAWQRIELRVGRTRPAFLREDDR